MSQLTIISHPPPKQIPFTAAMIGFLPPRRETPPKPESGLGRASPSAFDLFHSGWVLVDMKSVGLSSQVCISTL